jgi:hypothetical protein
VERSWEESNLPVGIGHLWKQLSHKVITMNPVQSTDVLLPIHDYYCQQLRSNDYHVPYREVERVREEDYKLPIHSEDPASNLGKRRHIYNHWSEGRGINIYCNPSAGVSSPNTNMSK